MDSKSAILVLVNDSDVSESSLVNSWIAMRLPLGGRKVDSSDTDYSPAYQSYPSFVQ
jgi:hypothetical protein